MNTSFKLLIKMKKLIFLIFFIPLVFFGQNKPSLDYLYPETDLIIKHHDDWGGNNYKVKIAEFKKEPLNYGAIVFLGNSITSGGKDWSKKLNYPNIYNRGIAGDVTDGVLARINEIVYFRPRAVFLLIGINDLWNNMPPSAEYVGNNILKIAQTIKDRSPKTKIYIQTILPVEKEVHKQSIKKVNDIIKSNLKDDIYKVIDLYSVFVDDKGLMKDDLFNDGIHLNEKGYAVWVQFIKSTVHSIKS